MMTSKTNADEGSGVVHDTLVSGLYRWSDPDGSEPLYPGNGCKLDELKVAVSPIEEAYLEDEDAEEYGARR